MDTNQVFTKILIAVDGSKASEKAAQKGLALASQLQVPVTLLSVIDRSQEILQTDLEVKPILTGTILEEQAQINLKRIIDSYVPSIMKEKVDKICLEGLPREEILSKINSSKADLLIVGTQARKGIMHFLLGSTAEFLVRHAGIPVMVVPCNKTADVS